MKTISITALAMMLLLNSCKKNTELPANIPVTDALLGKWQKGNYDMSKFWLTTSWESSGLYTSTGGFHIKNNDSAELYGVSYPPLPTDCSKQDYKYIKGTYSINMQDSTFSFTPSEGTLRTFYKNCTAQPDVSRDLTATELGGTLTFYWRLKTDNGKTYMLIRYAPDATTYTWMEKME
jgi:hypothetical protein